VRLSSETSAEVRASSYASAEVRISETFAVGVRASKIFDEATLLIGQNSFEVTEGPLTRIVTGLADIVGGDTWPEETTISQVTGRVRGISNLVTAADLDERNHEIVVTVWA